MTKIACLVLFLSNLSMALPSRRADLVRQLSELHKLNWARADVQVAEKQIRTPLTVTTAEIPTDSIYAGGPCDGSVYATNSYPDVSVRLEFRKSVTADRKCAVSLYSARMSVAAERSDAAALQVAIVAALQAAGKTCDSESSEYRWRSDDSRTLFSLLVDIDTDQKDRLPVLSVWLRHIPVSPDMVDDLPFHKGFVVPSTSAQAK